MKTHLAHRPHGRPAAPAPVPGSPRKPPCSLAAIRKNVGAAAMP
ncbi:MAG: hypothetical protein AW07_00237 [Candidatus Accumulibacter sp. SK-11]|nr:MAG: hypothetical protein AW07_00237 [Candidatus Accumulibacter sp. SK-11]